MFNEPLVAGLGGAVLGALISALLVHFLARPKPKVGILAILLDPMQPTDKEAISREFMLADGEKLLATPSDFRQLMRDNYYVQSPDAFYQHASQYTAYLYDASNDNERARLERSDLPRVVRELRDALNTRRITDFLLTWADYSNVLTPELRGAVVMNNFAVDTTDRRDGDRVPDHPITQDVDGDYFVHLGRLRIPLVWTTDSVNHARLRPFMENVAYAFAYEDHKIMDQLLSVVEKVDWTAHTLDRTRNRIREQLHNYDRLVVRGVISNSGRSPISVAGRCRLVLYSKDFGYRDQQGDEQVIKNAMTIELFCVDVGLLGRVPSIQVGAGGAEPFVAISAKYMCDQQEAAAIRAVLRSERHGRVIFDRIDTGKPLQSALVSVQSR